MSMLDRDSSEGLADRHLCLVGIVALLLIVSRRPSDLLHAQFYAEDGTIWFSQAYNFGWLRSLTLPDAGYLQTLPRFAAGLALLFPLLYAPLIMNLVGILFEILPVMALLSKRSSPWGSLRVRMLMALAYVFCTNFPEVHLNITNGQWHLALLEILLAFGYAPPSRTGKAFDLLVFLLGALSGPFGIILFPFVAAFGYLRNQKWNQVLACLLALGGVIQLLVMHFSFRFSPAPLNPSFSLLGKILGGDIFLGALFGVHSMSSLPASVLFGAFLAGSFLVAYALKLGTLSLRFFAAFTAIVFAAALKTPLLTGTDHLWLILFHNSGSRYFFFPSLLFLWSAAYCGTLAPRRLMRHTALATMSLMAVGVWLCWWLPVNKDNNFKPRALSFEQAPRGTKDLIPITPDGWQIVLTKR